MRNIYRKIREQWHFFSAFILLLLLRYFPHSKILELTRKKIGFQLNQREISQIISSIRRKHETNFLVFGLGKDTRLWLSLNRKGRTFFLEDQPVWLKLVKSQIRNLKAYDITYCTKVSDWKYWFSKPDSLNIDLPDCFKNIEWDVILVDGPRGDEDWTPGRLQSIYTASRLAGPKTDIFVHDCDRIIEKSCTNEFIGEGHLICQVDRLRHYRGTKVQI